MSAFSDWKSKLQSKSSFTLKHGGKASLYDKPLFTLCFLLAYQIRKFIGLFESVKQDSSTDKMMIDQL